MSSSNQQFVIANEERIHARQAEFRTQLAAFVAMPTDTPIDEKRRQFLELIGHATDFGNLCEQSIGNASLLGATKDEEWAKTKAETSLDVLDHIHKAQDALISMVHKLGLPAETVRPSPMAYASLQRNAAMFFPERVDALRRSFLDVELPVTGFDEIAPVSLPRRELRTLRSRWRGLQREVEARAATSPDSAISVDAFSAQALAIEAEGARLIAAHANWLAEQWNGLSFHRRRQPLTFPHIALLPDAVTLQALLRELGERLEILDLIDDELVRIERHAESASAHYFHVLVKLESGARAIALDLTHERLTQDVVEPLLAGKVVRIDGHAVSRDAPVLKISRTDRDSTAFAREYDQQMRKNGVSDLSTDRRQLPIERGQDVTGSFLEPVVPTPKQKYDAGDHAVHTHRLIAWFVFVLGIATIIAGVVAFIVSSTGNTSLELFGASLKTSNVGTACILGGGVITFFGLRAVLGSMRDLAKLKLEAAQLSKPKRRARNKKADG